MGSLSGSAERPCLAAALPLQVCCLLTISENLASVQKPTVGWAEIIRVLTCPRLECYQPGTAQQIGLIVSAAFPVVCQSLDLRAYPQSFLGINDRLAQRRPLPQQCLMRHLHGAFLTDAVAGQQTGVDERLDDSVFRCAKMTAFDASSSRLTCLIDRDELQQRGQNQTSVSAAVQFVGEQVGLPLQRADHASERFVSFGGHRPLRTGTCIAVELLQGPGEQREGVTSCGVLHHPLDEAGSEIESCPLRGTLNDLWQPSPAERLNQQRVIDCLS